MANKSHLRILAQGVEVWNSWRDEEGSEVKPNFDRADFSGWDLSEANLSYADLWWANLSETNLSKAELSSANLTYANLSGADLGLAVISSSILSEVDLYGAVLGGAYLSGLDLSQANLDKNYRDLLKGQSLNTDSPISYVDMSAKEPWSSAWKTNCRARIKGCNGAIALLSSNSLKADGQKWEIKCAREEGVP
jgi:uncharacterized protein YjbI with pentapeptide repeats